MIRVLIVEEHDRVRLALEARLHGMTDLQVVKSTREYADAVRDAQACGPDVILMEVKAPQGMVTLRALREALPLCAVIVLTSYLDSREEESVLEMGASAYLLKTLDTQALVRRIHESVSWELSLQGLQQETGKDLVSQ
ncbi:MAG: response regulator transcription factor [Anaerolineae bacterium]|nr:response regulator transcription factor [Anaerolineae bacterium]